MRNHKPRMFKHRSSGRNFRRQDDSRNLRLIPGHYSNGAGKSNFKPYQSAEKLLERYKILSKEALSSGDRISSENYLQHVEHFERIISHKNSNQNTSQVANITKEQVPNITKEKEQDSNLPNNKEINQNHLSKDKK